MVINIDLRERNPILHDRSWTVERITPQEAVDGKSEYLELSNRKLPLRPVGMPDIPSMPWVEYATNRFDANRKLFGRYETVTRTGLLRVDYRLDGVPFCEQYRYFDTVELFEISLEGDTQHMIVQAETAEGNMMGSESALLKISAGYFKLGSLSAKRAIIHLASDLRTKFEIRRVLADIFQLTKIEKLSGSGKEEDEKDVT